VLPINELANAKDDNNNDNIGDVMGMEE